MEVDLEVVEDQDGITLTGSLGAAQGNVSFVSEPTRTLYVLDARVESFALDGIAKLESEPNVCLLWDEETDPSRQSFRCHLGIGCRGFFGKREKS